MWDKRQGCTSNSGWAHLLFSCDAWVPLGMFTCCQWEANREADNEHRRERGHSENWKRQKPELRILQAMNTPDVLSSPTVLDGGAQTTDSPGVRVLVGGCGEGRWGKSWRTQQSKMDKEGKSEGSTKGREEDVISTCYFKVKSKFLLMARNVALRERSTAEVKRSGSVSTRNAKDTWLSTMLCWLRPPPIRQPANRHPSLPRSFPQTLKGPGKSRVRPESREVKEWGAWASFWLGKLCWKAWTFLFI